MEGPGSKKMGWNRQRHEREGVWWQLLSHPFLCKQLWGQLHRSKEREEGESVGQLGLFCKQLWLKAQAAQSWATLRHD